MLLATALLGGWSRLFEAGQITLKVMGGTGLAQGTADLALAPAGLLRHGDGAGTAQENKDEDPEEIMEHGLNEVNYGGCDERWSMRALALEV